MSNIAITEKRIEKQNVRKVMPIPWKFSDKVTYGIDFTDEAVV